MAPEEQDSVQYTQVDARAASMLAERVTSLEINVSNLIGSIEKLNASFERLVSKINTGTPWAMLASWSAVILTVIGGIGWLVVSPLQAQIVTLEERLDSVRAEIVLHYRDGHPQRVEEAITSLTDRIRSIEGARKSDADDPQWERIRALERAVFGKIEPDQRSGP